MEEQENRYWEELAISTTHEICDLNSRLQSPKVWVCCAGATVGLRRSDVWVNLPRIPEIFSKSEHMDPLF